MKPKPSRGLQSLEVEHETPKSSLEFLGPIVPKILVVGLLVRQANKVALSSVSIWKVKEGHQLFDQAPLERQGESRVVTEVRAHLWCSWGLSGRTGQRSVPEAWRTSCL